MNKIIFAANTSEWRLALEPFGDVDSTYLPEYHLAYSLRVKNSSPILWQFTKNNQHFVYPFLLTPVFIGEEKTNYFDISSVYGYTGPLSTTSSDIFLTDVWKEFDSYTSENKIIAEFIRFSPFNKNEGLAHQNTIVAFNRTLAASYLPKNDDELLKIIPSKTRNMIRKAEKLGLVSRDLPIPNCLNSFRKLYADTMQRNNAPEFFLYDDDYYKNLTLLGKGLRLFGVFSGDSLVAASMAVVHNKSGLYHLGASILEYARMGAGNLSLYEMTRSLMNSGVTFINMTGGRTTANDDPLLLFKKNNSTGTADFYIGKRIINKIAYNEIRIKWSELYGTLPDINKIIFWR